MNSVSTDQLEQLINSDGADIALINVVPTEFHESMHIPGSTNNCVYEIVFVDEVKETFPDLDQPIVVYGRSNGYGAAERAAGILETAGYKNISTYDDGVEGWRAAGKIVSGTQEDVHQFIPDGRYELDLSGSYLQWEGSNISNRHYGKIGLTSGSIQFQADQITSGSLTINMTDIGSEDLAGTPGHDVLVHHIQSADFFLADEYPEAVLEISAATRIPAAAPSEPNYQASGTLNLRGVTNPLEWQMTVGLDEDCPIAQGHLLLDRTRWGAIYGSGKFYEWLGQHLVHDLVHLRFKLMMCPA